MLRREAKTIIRHHGNYIMGYILNAGFAEDVEFRMWENHADTRIMAAIENAYDTYYQRKEQSRVVVIAIDGQTISKILK